MDNSQNQQFVAPTPSSTPQPQPRTPNPGQPNVPQTYSEPLVIKTSITRFFLGLAGICILISLAIFILKQIDANNDVMNTIELVLDRVNTIAIFARIGCLGFATAATIIKVLNPHPYNTKSMIAAIASVAAIGLSLIIFR